MFKVTRCGTDRLDIEMSGRLDAAAMQRALDDLSALPQNIEHGTLLYEVVDFHLPTIEAVVIEFACAHFRAGDQGIQQKP